MDFNNTIRLSDKVFLQEKMFGEKKYRYWPNMGIYNVIIWSGLHFESIVLEATAEATSAINKYRPYRVSYFETDEHGFKKTNFSAKDSAYNIFFLGDSFTEGLWMTSEDSFVNQFGLISHDNGISITPINLGVNGYSALESAWMLEKYAPILKPKIAVLNLFPNDVHKNYITAIRGENVPEENYTDMFNYIQRIKNFCEASNIKLVISVIPAKNQFNELREYTSFQDRVKSWSDTQGVMYLDPRKYFSSIVEKNIYFSWDAHFSERGNKYYASFLYNSLSPLLVEQHKLFLKSKQGKHKAN